MFGLWDESLHFPEEEIWEGDCSAFMDGVEHASSVHDHGVTWSDDRLDSDEHEENGRGYGKLIAARHCLTEIGVDRN